MIDEAPDTRSWLRRLGDGQTEALAELFEHYRPRLDRMVRLRLDRRLVGRVEPPDVLQEAYLDAAKRIQDYLQEPTVTAYIWLRGLTMERLLRLHRRHLAAKCRTVERECTLPEASSILLGLELLAKGTNPSKALRREELRRLVQGALEKLNPDDREVILMRHFEEMSNGDVAQVLGLDASAASMRYGRAVFRLKQLLMADISTVRS